MEYINSGVLLQVCKQQKLRNLILKVLVKSQKNSEVKKVSEELTEKINKWIIPLQRSQKKFQIRFGHYFVKLRKFSTLIFARFGYDFILCRLSFFSIH